MDRRVLWVEESGGHLFHSAAHRLPAQPARQEKLSIEPWQQRAHREAEQPKITTTPPPYRMKLTANVVWARL